MFRPWYQMSGNWWIAIIIMASGKLLSQSQWNSSGCGSSRPTLDRIMIDACAPYEPDEYFIFHTGSQPFNPTGGLSIQVNVTSSPYVSDGWGSNPSALADLNQSSGCGEDLFLDPFVAPYNGTIPPYSNVLAFVQHNPDFGGSVSGLCGEGGVFVLFGNFSHSFASSMFGNTCTDCTRNIKVELGSCSYDIVYEPEDLNGGNGAYISGSGSSVNYGNAGSCRPVFHHFSATPEPALNREEVVICANDDVVSGGFEVRNGNQFTTWYTDPDDPPIHRGSIFNPPLSLFPVPIDGEVATRTLYVVNVNGGRPGGAVPISLITQPAPPASDISLRCYPDVSCGVCEGENVDLAIELQETYGNELQIQLSDGSNYFSYSFSGEGMHELEMPAAASYELTAVSNEYGCTVTDGFGNDQVIPDIQSPATSYLPEIPDLCLSAVPYPLAPDPGGITGQWMYGGDVIIQIIPEEMGEGMHSLQFIPEEECALEETVEFEILGIPETAFDLIPIDCGDDFYAPVWHPGTAAGGTWSITPSVPIDPASGEVLISDLEAGESYAWTYAIDLPCEASSTVVLVAPDCNCTITATATHIECQNNGTPADPTDDTYTFDLIVTGANTSVGWVSEDGSLAGGYGTTATFGPYPISESEKTLTLTDEADPTCQTILSIEPPPTCSNICTISATVSNIQCQDNGSPTDPTDDTYTFDLTVTGANTSGGWVSEDGSLAGGYGTTATFGPYPISESEKTLTLTDESDPNCQTTITIEPPPSCSNTCTISATASNIQCQDNGSPTDPTDDTYTFELSVGGTNFSDGWVSENGNMSGKYGTPALFGPFAIADGEKTLSLTDEADPTCQTTITIEPPPSCSNTCSISATTSNIQCQDNGSPTDPTDDMYSFALTVTGANTSGGWVSEDGSLAGEYGTTATFGSYPISDGEKTLTLTDEVDTSCQTTITIEPPPTCSNTCTISATVSNIQCHDNSSPTDPTDDTYTFDLTVTGANTSGGWVSMDGALSGVYGTPVIFGPFAIADGEKTLTLTDEADHTCQTTLSIEPPPSCSNTCSISATTSNIQCQDNGSPTDPTDDTYTFDLTVTGANTAGGWVSEDGGLAGGYGTTATFGPYPITDGETLTLTDEADPTCQTTITIEPPPNCSNTCTISTNVSNIQCRDNSSPTDPTDDTYTFDLTVTGANTSGGWVSEDGSLAGKYGTNATLGPYAIANGEQTLTLTDEADPTCQTTITIEPPPTCSNTCIISATVSNIQCQDNGSPTDPTDPTDDTYTFDLTVTGANTSGGWISRDGSLAGGYGTATFGPFAIADGEKTLTLIDEADPACLTTITIEPPGTCSNTCTISATASNIQCQDNGSPTDPTDDTYTFELSVGGTNFSDGWVSENGNMSGKYGTPALLGPFAIADGEKTITLTDEADPACQTILSIEPPPTCSSTCTISATVSNIQCHDNSSPTDPTDDMYSFALTVTGANTAGGWVSEDGGLAGGYGTTTTFGPYPIEEGEKILTVTDEADPTCLTTITIEPPPICSNTCTISASVSNIRCQDNGSPTDSTDDTYTFDLTVRGANTSGGWVSEDGGLAGKYGTPAIFGPYPISEGETTLTLTDEADPTCLTTITIEPPSTCSSTCTISATVSNIQCQDNNSPTDPTDDTYTFDLTVRGANTSGGWVSDDGGLAGGYGTTATFGPYPIAEGEKSWTLMDENDANCLTTVSIKPPSTCSNICGISAIISNIQCQNNGTPTDSIDDKFTFDVEITGKNTAGSWISDKGMTGGYDTLVSFGPLPVSDGTKQIMIRDIENPDCQTTLYVNPPPACSNECRLEASVQDIKCHDNGTPRDTTDDVFTFDLLVTGVNTSTGWSSNESRNGIYNKTMHSKPIPIASGSLHLKITDALDSTCNSMVTITPPVTCSKPCDWDVRLRDSCSKTPDGQFLFYYFLESRDLSVHHLYRIEYRNEILDIIPAQNDLPIGPFHEEDIGKMLTVKPEYHPDCQKLIPLHRPVNCMKFPTDNCVIKINDFQIRKCEEDELSGGVKALIRFDITTNQFPLNLSVNHRTYQMIPRAGVDSMEIRLQNPGDSIPIQIQHPEGCITVFNVNNPCRNSSSTFPNAFSPNHDGINDVWRIRLPDKSSHIEFKIYDRWGNLVHSKSTADIPGDSIEWDGQSIQNSTDVGVFVYEISWMVNGEWFYRRGELLILR